MRTAKINRKTKETDILCEINLDGTGKNDISTNIGFLDHMLEIFSHHSLVDLKLRAKGDIHVDLQSQHAQVHRVRICTPSCVVDRSHLRGCGRLHHSPLFCTTLPSMSASSSPWTHVIHEQFKNRRSGRVSFAQNKLTQRGHVTPGI